MLTIITTIYYLAHIVHEKYSSHHQENETELVHSAVTTTTTEKLLNIHTQSDLMKHSSLWVTVNDVDDKEEKDESRHPEFDDSSSYNSYQSNEDNLSVSRNSSSGALSKRTGSISNIRRVLQRSMS